MTPLTREEREAIIRSHPAAAPGEIDADIDEYERLVAAMFSRDPEQQAADAALESEAMDRLNELQAKLFP